MTVSSTLSRQTFSCDGSTRVFTLPFRVLASTEVVGYLLTTATGASALLTNGADFTVTGVGTANAIVTTTATYGSAYQVRFIRATARTQLTDYRDNDPFPEESHEEALDRLTHISQEIDGIAARAITFPEPESGQSLPSALSRALTTLGFDASGNLTTYDLLSVDGIVGTSYATSVVVSTAGQTVLLTPTYVPGTSAIAIFADGYHLTSGTDYTETSTTSVTLAVAAVAGTEYVIRAGRSVTSGVPSASVGYTAGGSGSVARSAESIFGERLSVKSKGAVGNGSTDDTAAINNAIADLNAGVAKTLYFPAGTYRINGALTTITASGVTLVGDGPRQSVLYQVANADTLKFEPTVPATDFIGDICIDGIGFDQQGVTAPTSGVALTLVKVTRGYFGIDIRNVFGGVLIQGCNDIRFQGPTITGSYSWSSLATGSFLVKFQRHSSGALPSEIYFDNFNIKGVGSFGATLYQASGVIIEAGDGLFFSNGHLGFSHNASLYINPQATAGASVQNLEFAQVYFDGNGAGNSSTSLVLIAGSTTPTVEHFTFTGCQFKNFDGNAFDCNLSTLRDLRISGGEVSDNGGYGLILTSLQDFSVTGVHFKGNNGGALATSSAIALAGCVNGVVSGNRLMAGATAHSVGLDVNATCSDLVIQGNVFGGHTADMAVASGAARITFGGNRKSGSDPTVASASTVTLPVGYDVVNVTGTTTIATINTPIEKHRVTLVFASTAGLTDGSNLSLAGNFSATAGSTITLMGYGSNWVEVSRAVV